MRIDLKVPYEEKDAAKRLGARWDPARKVWHLIDPPDLMPFRRWLGLNEQHAGAKPKSKRAKIKAQQADPRNRPPKSGPAVIQQRDSSLPSCGCTHAPPWEVCCELVSELAVLDPDQSEHMRAIAAWR